MLQADERAAAHQSRSDRVMLRESPPVVRISISPWLRFTTLGNFSPHSTRTMLSGLAQLVEAQGIQLPLVLDPVQIEVIENHRLLVPVYRTGAFVFVDQRKRRAGHFVRLGGIQCLGNALHQGGFARAQIAAQHEELRRRQQLRNAVADLDRLLAAVAWN